MIEKEKEYESFSQDVGYAGLFVGALAILGALLEPSIIEAMERHETATRAYNCHHYGAAMNDHYGEQVCPATTKQEG